MPARLRALLGDAQRRARLVHQPAVVFVIRPAAAAKRFKQRKQRSVMLVEKMLFNPPAPGQAKQLNAVGLAEALGKGLFAGEPGLNTTVLRSSS